MLLASLWAEGALAQQAAEAAQVAASDAGPVASAPPPGVPMPAPTRLASPASMPAPTPVAAPDWRGLSRAQKQLLAPLEAEWNSLDAPRKGRWLELAARYPQLPADEQARIEQRLSSWAKLSTAERQQARLAFQAARQLKADEREAKWEAYQALPAERRQQLADKAAQKSESTSGGRPKPAGKNTANLVPVLPKAEPELPLGPTVLQAKPGASTVLINQGRPSGASPRDRRAKTAFSTDLLDSKTLLPKPPARRVSDTP